METVDALVAGAGPVGLTMAAELARHGVSCRIVDKSAAPTDKSKALVVWSRTLELLHDMGPVERFIAAGKPAHRISLYGDGERLAQITLAGVESPYPYALMIPQCETERLLGEHLRSLGVGVERNVELTGFQNEAEGVTCTLRRTTGADETVRVRWLIGCDGAHSTVRHALGVAFAGEPEPHDWVLADVHVEGPLPADEVSIFWHQRGLLAFFPIPPDRFRVIADLGLASSSDHPLAPTLSQAQELVDARGPAGLSLLNPVWLAGFRIHERKVADYSRGRVFLAGDAAHIHSPAGGQGMNTGMQDAYNLGWKLGLVNRGRAAATLLESYNVERGAVGTAVLQRAGAMTRAATLQGPVAQGLRNRIVSILLSFGIVQQRMTRMLSEIDINYRGSPLSGENRAAARTWRLGGGVSAGDRIPNATLLDPGVRRETTLFEVLRGTKHVLLLLSGPGAEEPAFRTLAGISAAVARRYGEEIVTHLVAADDSLPSPATWSGSVFCDPKRELHRVLDAGAPAFHLIRPDGYVGYRGEPAEWDGLLAHLERYLVPIHG